MTVALIGLLGVIVGGVISAIVRYIECINTTTAAFKMAALEKRLAAHQEAYALCHKLKGAVQRHSIERAPVANECEQWWNDHCLYLGDQSRNSFAALLDAYVIYDPDTHHPRQYRDFIDQAFRPALDAICRDVSLPPMAYHRTDTNSDENKAYR